MKGLLTASFMLLALVGCGARTVMEACAEGSAQCTCYDNGACDPGLACRGGMCRSISTPTGSGGDVASGGAAGNASVTASGGAVGGTTTATGGVLASGGVVSSGGSASGGRVGSGGSASGGRAGSGGIVGSGGLSTASGGKQGSGGTTAAVTIVRGQAAGAMDGWGWVAFGALDVVTSPTCGGRQLSSPGGCSTSYDWASGGGLCISGSVPQVTDGDYSSNWGILAAAECRDVAGGTLDGSFNTVSFNVSGATFSGLRAVVHRRDDGDSYNFCANMTPGKAIAFTAFNSACWDGTGEQLTLADVPNLDWLGIQVPSSSTTAYKITSPLCLNAIIFQ